MLEVENKIEKLCWEDKEDVRRYLKFIRKKTGIIQGDNIIWAKFSCDEDLWKIVGN